MTLEYRCSKCGALLETTNADPLIAGTATELIRLREVLRFVHASATSIKEARQAAYEALSIDAGRQQ